MHFRLLLSLIAFYAMLHIQAIAETQPSHETTAMHRGIWQLELSLKEQVSNPFFDVDLKIHFTRPDGSQVNTDGFFKGDKRWGGRAYCDQLGTWSWLTTSAYAPLNGKSGSFEVIPSKLPGKLRQHPDDSQQFAYDNGDWFLHIGDTGYRYLADTEPLWQQYIDEAAQVGFTKIRTWFCRGRSDVKALFTPNRDGLALAYWDEMEKRLLYALEKYPHIQFQLIPFGEDSIELRRYGAGDPASLLMVRYAQARFSAFPNVQWCIVNDRYISKTPSGSQVSPDLINTIGRDMHTREPWGTLLTNHQVRLQGYSFVNEDWSDIVTLEDRDQITGDLIRQYRAKGSDPVVLDEDRYGIYISPKHDRYFFRRLMWASLFSGGHATYGGLETYEAFDGPDKTKGVQGYLTAVKDGRLDDGAHDFRFIQQFFRDTKLTLVGLEPSDKLVEKDDLQVNVIANNKTIMAYLHNPSPGAAQEAKVSETPASCRLTLPEGTWNARWFNPRTGLWHDIPKHLSDGKLHEFKAPFTGDSVLLLARLRSPIHALTIQGTPNVSTYDNKIYFAGQPSQESFTAFKELGIKTVINLRTTAEVTSLGFDEQQVVETAGMKYIHFPMGRELPAEKVLEEMMTSIAMNSDAPVLIHCASSNRVGTIWAYFTATREGLSTEDAIAEGKSAGMRSSSFEQAIRQALSH